jgi:hypothetical protein
VIIDTKQKMFAAMDRGSFGNHLQSWTWREWLQSQHVGPAVIRYMEPGSGFYAEANDYQDVINHVSSMLCRGAKRGLIRISEMAPDDWLLIQGEVSDIDGLFTFRHSSKKSRMRDAMKCCADHAYGLKAKNLLRSSMDASSYEDLQVLLDRYPGHVVELSVYARTVGLLKRNTLFWEARAY